MIFVFDVISGKFLAFEKHVSISLVADLRTAIEKATGLTVANQILLASGGQVPLAENTVDSYDVGSEDNPYFLFARPAGTDLGRSIISPDDLVPTTTGASGTHLLTTAEQLVHAQHLQHQGWQAAVGNLSDVTSNVRTASNTLRRRLESLQNDETRLSSVECISVEEDGAAVEDIVQRLQIASNLLRRLPLPVSFKNDDVDNVCDLLSSRIGMSSASVIDEIQNTKETAKDAFALLDTFEKWATEGERTDMREISGLTDRLGHLDQLLNNARLHCAAGGVSTSPPRFTGASSPPAHFISRPLSDVVARCAAAAAELRNNLNQRVEWLSVVQSRLARCAAHFVITSASIRRRHKAIRNALSFVSAPPFYVKLALAQHACNSTLFMSCVPCPIHSQVSASDSFQNVFTHPLSTIFHANAKRHLVHSHSGNGDASPVIFTSSDLSAIQEAAPSLFADQQVKFKQLQEKDHKEENTARVDQQKQINELAAKMKSALALDRTALSELRVSVESNFDSSAKLIQECRLNFEKIISESIGAGPNTLNVKKTETRDVAVATDEVEGEIPPASANASAPTAESVSSGNACGVAATREVPATSSSRPQARLNVALSGISAGDLVIVTWSDQLDQPVILTISPVPHLIHQDSIDALSQAVPQNPILSWLNTGDLILGGSPLDQPISSSRPPWFQPPNHYRLAEVLEKQHCQVRRASNRYRLQVNTRFFRLRVRPVCVEPAMSSAASAPALNMVGLANVSEERRQSVDSEQVLAGTSP